MEFRKCEECRASVKLQQRYVVNENDWPLEVKIVEVQEPLYEHEGEMVCCMCLVVRNLEGTGCGSYGAGARVQNHWESIRIVDMTRCEVSDLERKRRAFNKDRKLKRLVMERDAYRCIKCETYKDLTVDHIVPLAKGGENKEDNLQTMCRSCNCSKGVKLQ